MAESKSTAATTNHVKGKDINGQMVTLERTQPRQLSLFQTFLPDEERYSNTIDLYDALPKYFSNHTIMRSLRKSGQYLPVLKREFEHKGTMCGQWERNTGQRRKRERFHTTHLASSTHTIDGACLSYDLIPSTIC